MTMPFSVTLVLSVLVGCTLGVAIFVTVGDVFSVTRLLAWHKPGAASSLRHWSQNTESNNAHQVEIASVFAAAYNHPITFASAEPDDVDGEDEDALAQQQRSLLMKETMITVLALWTSSNAHTEGKNEEEEVWPFELTVAHGRGAPKHRLMQSVHFLVTHMPAEDTDGRVGVDFLARNVLLAWAARLHSPWGRKVPWLLFLNDVLPYACLREPRDEWRPLFAAVMPGYLASEATPTTTAGAALLFNAKAWGIVDPPIKFLAATTNGLNSYSVFQTMQRHNSSCTGLSIFLLSALRSVGVPARVSGVPHWNRGHSACPDGDASEQCGNHNWVEIWSNVDGRWHFLDQDAKPNELDVAWFYPAGMQGLLPLHGNHSIYSSSWAPTETLTDIKEYESDHALAVRYFPLAWDWSYEGVRAWDNTAMYEEKNKKSIE